MSDSTGETYEAHDDVHTQRPKHTKSLASWHRGGNAVSALSSMVAPAQIAVFCRFRPLGESVDSLPPCVRVAPGSVTVRDLAFPLDQCFDPAATQQEVFDAFARERVLAVLEGRHASILAYGQTGSGKTHSMFGSDEVLKDPNAAAHAASHGLVLRAAALLFEQLSRRTDDASRPVVTMSFLEVYNDRVHDLLAAPSAAVAAAPRSLALREAQGCVVVERLSRTEVRCAEDVGRLVQRGTAARIVGPMRMNARSSRGHGLLQLHVTVAAAAAEAEAEAEGRVLTATLNLLDLAGMETSKSAKQRAAAAATAAATAPAAPRRRDMAGASGDASAHPLRREETRNINQSLYALGTVVERLASPSSSSTTAAVSAPGSSAAASTAVAANTRSGSGGLAAKLHVPWRDSKLTRLLQGTLGAAAILLTLRAETEHLDETLSTLRFGVRAKAARVERGDEISTEAAASSEAMAIARAKARHQPEQLLRMQAERAQEQAERAQGQVNELRAQLARSRRETELARRAYAATGTTTAATTRPSATPPRPSERRTHEQRVSAVHGVAEPSGPSLGGRGQSPTSATFTPPGPRRRRRWLAVAAAAAAAVVATMTANAWPALTALEKEAQAQSHRELRERVGAQMRGQPSAPLGARLLLARSVRGSGVSSG